MTQSRPQPQPQPQPAHYSQPAQPQPYYGASNPNYYNGHTGAAAAPAPAAQAQPPAANARQITLNGAPASAHDFATLDALEREWGSRLPNGHYWYDSISGAAGYWGGPMIGTLPAGLQLGGRLPANASGGGNGMLTGVFINGRELHPQDVAQLQALIGDEVPRGRWWVDGNGNFGVEGGAAMGNLYTLSQQRGGGGRTGRSESSTSRNGSVYTRGGCVQVTGSDGSTMSTGC